MIISNFSFEQNHHGQREGLTFYNQERRGQGKSSQLTPLVYESLEYYLVISIAEEIWTGTFLDTSVDGITVIFKLVIVMIKVALLKKKTIFKKTESSYSQEIHRLDSKHELKVD